MNRADAIIKRLDVDSKMIGAEIGVYEGKLSNELLKRLPNLCLYMIDRWGEYSQKEKSGNKFSVMSQRGQDSFDAAYKKAEAVRVKYSHMIMKTEQEQQFHAEMLADVKKVLDKHSVTNILTGSALLGLTRDGDMVPWCPGAVLTVFADEIEKSIVQIKKDLESLGFVCGKYSFGKTKLRVGKKNLNIEIVAYKKNNKYYYRNVGKKIKRYPLELLMPPHSKINLRGYEFNAPKDIIGFLEYTYTDWRTPMTGSPSAYKTKKHQVIKS